ncbi:MAG: glycosyltransferase family 2 protein [Clostridia bacterium]|jgi:glycosyltransferase involved in cell wall biosynthesis
MKVSAIIPAYNEEERIGMTIKSLHNISEIDQVIVVDDGSNDQTGKIAQGLKAQVIRLNKNRGKAFALLKGYEWANGDILLFVDGDLGQCAVELRHLIEPVRNGEADITIAKFPETEKKAGFGFAKGLASWGVERITGVRISCVLSGQRAVLRDKLQESFLMYKGFGVETGMTIDLILSGCRFKEVPLALSHRESGRDIKGFIHRYKQFLDILSVVYQKGAFRWQRF